MLCLAAGISTLYLGTVSNEMQAATGSFTVPEITPTPSPTPSPSPSATLPPTATPTSTPTVEPTPTPTETAEPTPTPTQQSGGGRAQPSISLKLNIEVLGEYSQWLRDSAGKVLEDVTAASEDGMLTLLIHKGTYVLDVEGKPLTQMNITSVDFFVKAPPPENYFIYMYEISPVGAYFSNPVDIVISYDPSDFPKSVNELLLKIYAYDKSSDTWQEVPCSVDVDNGIVSLSFSSNYLNIYVLSAEPILSPQPVPQPSPQHHASGATTSHSNWILLILILPAVSLIFFIYVLIRWRRISDMSEDSLN